MAKFHPGLKKQLRQLRADVAASIGSAAIGLIEVKAQGLAQSLLHAGSDLQCRIEQIEGQIREPSEFRMPTEDELAALHPEALRLLTSRVALVQTRRRAEASQTG